MSDSATRFSASAHAAAIRRFRREIIVGGIMRPGTLLKTDKCTIAVETAPKGKIRVLTNAWAEPVVILADEVLELRIRQGQVHILRKPRIENDEDRELRAVNAPYLGDDV
jgi:hypothetical protein